MLRYAPDAIELMDKLKNFDTVKFESWVRKLIVQIGSNFVLQYLEEKKRWNVKAQLNNKDILKIDFSAQAKNIIQHLKDFDSEDCIVWFNNAVQMTKGDILNYLEETKHNVQ